VTGPVPRHRERGIGMDLEKRPRPWFKLAMAIMWDGVNPKKASRSKDIFNHPEAFEVKNAGLLHLRPTGMAGNGKPCRGCAYQSGCLGGDNCQIVAVASMA